MEQCNPFRFDMFPLSKKSSLQIPDLGIKEEMWEIWRHGEWRDWICKLCPGRSEARGTRKRQERQRGKKMVKATNAEILDGLLFFCIYKGKIDLQRFWLAKVQKQMEQWSFCFAIQGSSSACSSGLCRAGVDLVSSSKGRDRQRPWDLKVGRVRKVRFGSTQQSNPDPSAHLARLATHWPEATNSAAARGLTPSML